MIRYRYGMAKLVIKRSDLSKYLRDTFTARQLATIGGISTQYAYAVLEGNSTPSFEVLDKLGIQILYDASGVDAVSK
jgi:transcriptional regulator with XRE-family HTH domain